MGRSVKATMGVLIATEAGLLTLLSVSRRGLTSVSPRSWPARRWPRISAWSRSNCKNGSIPIGISWLESDDAND